MRIKLFRVLLIFITVLLSGTIFLQDRLIAQPITNDGLALTITSGLTMTLSGDFVNQNSGTIANSGIIEATGNWTNNSSGNVFSSSAGNVRFIGSGAQTIGGTSATTFYDFTINNAAGAALTSNMNVSDSLAMTNGKLNLSNNTLTLGSSAAIPGKLYYLNGWMYGGTFRRWFSTSAIANGAAAGLFPTGSSSDYRPVYISAPSSAPATGGTISVSHTSAGTLSFVLFTDSDVTINRRYDSYWSLSTGNGLSGGTYNIRAEGTGFASIPLLSSLRLIQALSAAGAYGTNAGTLLNPQVNRTGLSLAQLTNNFYFGYPISALPVELISFNANYSAGFTALTWKTASEVNSDYYIVERSPDFLNFVPVAKIKAIGNSTETTDYFANDFSPSKGWNYYRLMQTDFNGTVHYSKIISVNTDNYINENIIINNPVQDNLNFTFNTSFSGVTLFSLYDLTGKLVQSKEIESPEKNETFSMDCRMLKSGLYCLSIKNDKQSFQTKIFKI
ncbi:MAG TPA: T9SS type A sorting domain-containing protein [Bacteroidia bacterium]|nr:T9SS type A sorting domain-containing protein [Bacteroidia bacterium]